MDSSTMDTLLQFVVKKLKKDMDQEDQPMTVQERNKKAMETMKARVMIDDNIASFKNIEVAEVKDFKDLRQSKQMVLTNAPYLNEPYYMNDVNKADQKSDENWIGEDQTQKLTLEQYDAAVAQLIMMLKQKKGTYQFIFVKNQVAIGKDIPQIQYCLKDIEKLDKNVAIFVNERSDHGLTNCSFSALLAHNYVFKRDCPIKCQVGLLKAMLVSQYAYNKKVIAADREKKEEKYKQRKAEEKKDKDSFKHKYLQEADQVGKYLAEIKYLEKKTQTASMYSTKMINTVLSLRYRAKIPYDANGSNDKDELAKAARGHHFDNGNFKLLDNIPNGPVNVKKLEFSETAKRLAKK